ncbi:MAG: type II toxin-antitoxin system VapC family toxin [Candidatus Brocadiaceae bacterium]|nr:type II toxin-antitoxin system VapC family toxin [Candidatus Brocadiaceae bacterium]
MNGKCLLDTNIILALFASERSVMERLERLSEVFLPCIAVGELFFGAYKSKRVEKNIRRIREFISANTVLICDSETASFYGQIKNRLREKGKLIPENDIWISAIALQNGITLVSRDNHFKEVETLETQTW